MGHHPVGICCVGCQGSAANILMAQPREHLRKEELSKISGPSMATNLETIFVLVDLVGSSLGFAEISDQTYKQMSD